MGGIILVLLLWCAALFAIRRDLARAWAEPCLRHPVLVFEGDDWGYGPLEQTRALQAIAAELGRHRDATGRQPVMTLGVILAGPGAAEDPADALGVARVTLDDPRLAPLCAAMLEGQRAGVFDLQLHGMEHYLPSALLKAARQRAAVRDWLAGAPFAATEDLPSALQSRWTDASVLPSQAIDDGDIRTRVVEEVDAFRRCFGRSPEVVVPPTFVWDERVELAWAEQGVEVLVTPGERYEMRGADGLPVDTGCVYRNGQHCRSGLVAMVRDDYYEPVRGHEAGRGVAALAAKWSQRRPVLFETHRSNFVGTTARLDLSLRAIGGLVEAALRGQPGLRFMSVAELARQYADGGDLLDRRLQVRIVAALHRLDRPGRRRKVFALLLLLTFVLPWLSF